MIKTVPDALPLTFLTPETDAEPTLIFDAHAALVMALVVRSGVSGLPADWDVPGVYVLLEPADADGWSCYVGKAADRGLRTRVAEHVKGKPAWSRALLVARDTTHGFNSAEVGWLEGRLYDLFNSAAVGHLRNGNRPSDETLPVYQRAMLEACTLPISRVMRLLGYDTSTAEQYEEVASSRPQRTVRRFNVTVEQLLRTKLLTAPAQLVSLNGAWPATATLNADGTITYEGVAYANPSKAASVVKNGAANGWEFWAVRDAESSTALSTYRTRYLDSMPLRGDDRTPGG